MKRIILMSWFLVCAVPFAARADHEVDWNDWFEGDVQVRLRVGGGEGAVMRLGEPVRLTLEANEDAYHLVYAIDSDGYVRLLFPRYWEDNGWLFAHEELELHQQTLAWPANRWGTGGIVYVEAVASPVPFDFTALGVGFEAGRVGWVRQGRPFRISGDPFLAFNEVHQILFPAWEEAVFAVDYTYFYVGQMREIPRYLGYSYQRVYLPPPAPIFSVGLRFVWHWEFGRRYCRPIYTRYYVPGRHVVYHPLRGHQHVVYGAPARYPAPQRRPRNLPWVAPERKRVLHDTPVVRHRVRPQAAPIRERSVPEAPRVERKRTSQSLAEAVRRVMDPPSREPVRQRVESSAATRSLPSPAASVVKRGESARPVVKRGESARPVVKRGESAHPVVKRAEAAASAVRRTEPVRQRSIDARRSTSRPSVSSAASSSRSAPAVAKDVSKSRGSAAKKKSKSRESQAQTQEKAKAKSRR